MTGLGLTALLFALGTHTPVWGLFYALVPGIKLFRAPDMVMFLFVFAAGTLSALGFDRILQGLDDDSPQARRALKVLAGGAGGLGLLWVLMASGTFQSIWTAVVYRDISPGQEQLLEQIRPFIAQGAFVATALAALLAGLVWLGRRGTVAPTAILAGTVLLVAVDLLRVDASFVQTFDFYRWSQPDPNMRALLDRERDRTEPYRLLSFVQSAQDVDPAMYGIELAAGHHPNDLSRYRELIGMVGSGFPDNLQNPNIRRLLNVRYILWPDWQLGQLDGQGAVSRTQSHGQPFETLLAEGGLPRARLVAAATVKGDEEAVPYMLSEGFNPEAEVVLPEAPPVTLDGGAVTGEVRWDERSNNRLRLSVTSDRPALLVVADNWFPAWKASVDGVETPVLRAYHTLRAVPVPAGSSTVEMWYHSELLTRTLWLSLLVLLGLSAAGVVGVVQGRRRVA